MLTLLAGLVLWAVVHWFPLALPSQRSVVVTRLGELPYKGIFSLLTLMAIALIVIGWQQAPLVKAYVPPFFGNWPISAAITVAFILFFAPYIPNNIRRFIRHPQLSGVALWGIVHLLVNGTIRDVLLFGGFALWAIVAMVFANRRDGPWQKPAAVALWKDLVLVVVGVVVTAVVFHFHGQLFGVTPVYLG
jgi:uncharacterized membrane protein